MKIVVGTTLPAFVMDDPGLWGSWLSNAEAMRKELALSDPTALPLSVRSASVHFFAALQPDGRGMARFAPLLDRLGQVDGEYWTFTYNDHATTISTRNRIRRINMGSNMCFDYATDAGASHLLFISGDVTPPANILPKLLEMHHPVVGPDIPSYDLSGPEVPHFEFPVQEHLATAGCLMIERSVFTKLRWRDDPDNGITDDWCFQFDCRDYLGVPHYVRKDCIAVHYPEVLVPLEDRDIDRVIH